LKAIGKTWVHAFVAIASGGGALAAIRTGISGGLTSSGLIWGAIDLDFAQAGTRAALTGGDMHTAGGSSINYLLGTDKGEMIYGLGVGGTALTKFSLRLGMDYLDRQLGGITAGSLDGLGGLGTSSGPGLWESVYRGERSSKLPEDVFANGIFSKGDRMDLLAHASSNLPDSGYIATSPHLLIALPYANRNGYVYEIVPHGGINVNQTLGEASPFPEQMEVAIPRFVEPHNILGAYPMTAGKLGPYIPNPRLPE
jgi:hypothetical protein